jgi:hypothetical protein
MSKTFGAHTPLSTIAKPSTPSDMDISSSIGSLPSPLLFHMNLQDKQKKSLPILIPVKLPPINDLFEQNYKPQIAWKTVFFTKLLHPMEEIWAECAAQEATEADSKKPTIIAGNDNHQYTIDDWSLSLYLTTWDSPSIKKYMHANIT